MVRQSDPQRPRRALRRVEEISAGGLVLDRRAPDANGALIGRLDRRGRLLWSLPKGHLEAGESAPEAAA
ncbi:MAG TPA: NUDIX hydrolase, partial [Mycobacteriales bacterium]|nr:NUDIX hydrolase [Mycobacteriales bacterium]